MPIKGFLIIYLLLSAFDLAVIQFDLDIRCLSKPLILISLLIYYVSQLGSKWQPVDSLFSVALLFALGGDVLLLWDHLFVWGLGSFLVMQILYVLVFVRSKNYYGIRELIFALFLAAVIGVVLSRLWPTLDEMAIPVTIYSLAIAIMSWVAWTRDLRSNGYYLVWIGTLFFIVSDMSIALQTFGEYNLGKLTVMSTYALAQVLIVLGILTYRTSQYEG